MAFKSPILFPGGTNLVKAGQWALNVFGAIGAGTTATYPERNTLDIDAPTPSSAAVY